MAWHSSPRPVNDATMYTLREAAQQLGVDLKTLRKKMGHYEVVPTPDPTDKRALLLTKDQVEQLANLLAVPRLPSPSSDSFSADRSLEAMLVDMVKAKEQDLDRRSADLRHREQALSEQIEELSQLVRQLKAELRPKLDRLLTPPAEPDSSSADRSGSGARRQHAGVGHE
jgi:hypothetical protein